MLTKKYHLILELGLSCIEFYFEVSTADKHLMNISIKNLLLFIFLMGVSYSCQLKSESVLQQERADLFFAMDLVFSHKKNKIKKYYHLGDKVK